LRIEFPINIDHLSEPKTFAEEREKKKKGRKESKEGWMKMIENHQDMKGQRIGKPEEKLLREMWIKKIVKQMVWKECTQEEIKLIILNLNIN
jgi:hypothetical protein